MDLALFILTVAVIYLFTRGLLAMLTRELRARLQEHYRWVGPLVTPLHWVLLLASVLIGMSLMGRGTERFVLLFYLAIAWFLFRGVSILIFEWWFATVKGIQLPGIARRLISAVVVFAALLVFLRFRLDVRVDDLAVLTIVVGVVIALFFQGFLRDLFLGISMALEKPLRVGDFVTIEGQSGQVVAIDWKTTTLRGDDGARVIVPNRRIADGVLIHRADQGRRHGHLEIAVPADVPPSLAAAELTAAVAGSPDALADPPPEVRYRGESGGESRFDVSFWLPSSAATEKAQADLHSAIWYRLRRRGLIRHRSAPMMRTEQTRDALAELPFLAGATAAQIDRLAAGVRSAQYGKGEILFRQNDPGEELFLISSGTLDIFVMNGRHVEEKIASVSVGSFVGERSLLTGEPRSATVRAAEDCTVFVIGKTAMGELLREHPGLAREIAQTMAERDAQRGERTLHMMHEHDPEAANTLLRRIRDFFAIS